VVWITRNNWKKTKETKAQVGEVSTSPFQNRNCHTGCLRKSYHNLNKLYLGYKLVYERSALLERIGPLWLASYKILCFPGVTRFILETIYVECLSNITNFITQLALSFNAFCWTVKLGNLLLKAAQIMKVILLKNLTTPSVQPDQLNLEKLVWLEAKVIFCK